MCLYQVLFHFGENGSRNCHNAFKEESLSQARVYKWFSQFKCGDMSLEDQSQSGHPSTSRTDENIKKICYAIMFDHHQMIDKLEALTGVLWSSCQ
jgi:hypothetical protein